MSLYTAKPTTKVAFTTVALVTVLLIGGCDKKESTTDTTTDTATVTETTEAATTAPTTTDTTVNENNDNVATPEPAAPATGVDTTLAQLSSDTLNNMVFEPLINSGQLTAEQKACLEARDKNIGLAESQAYFESKLTKEELDKLNAFYSSDVGKKLIIYGNEQLQTLNGQQVTNPLPAPSEQEMAEMQQFMQSPVGQKYMALNNAEGAGSMYEALNPTIQAELSRCNINMNQ
ncbi:DUF2059 domain-containing protein [Psychrobacter sp. I-STPA10]|uniref:DUF2059 domain-containing protein n=1 Tax=Psychrobacter sp. I-STPA10 TaxID=2585769 RepID=UPI001E2A90FA|nr:DUF2059 domain-containing protein [Psychrobacter sp. I-STPA10]